MSDDDWLNVAATEVQRVWRGHAVRRHLPRRMAIVVVQQYLRIHAAIKIRVQAVLLHRCRMDRLDVFNRELAAAYRVQRAVRVFLGRQQARRRREATRTVRNQVRRIEEWWHDKLIGRKAVAVRKPQPEVATASAAKRRAMDKRLLALLRSQYRCDQREFEPDEASDLVSSHGSQQHASEHRPSTSPAVFGVPERPVGRGRQRLRHALAHADEFEDQTVQSWKGPRPVMSALALRPRHSELTPMGLNRPGQSLSACIKLSRTFDTMGSSGDVSRPGTANTEVLYSTDWPTCLRTEDREWRSFPDLSRPPSVQQKTRPPRPCSTATHRSSGVGSGFTSASVKRRVHSPLVLPTSCKGYRITTAPGFEFHAAARPRSKRTPRM